MNEVDRQSMFEFVRRANRNRREIEIASERVESEFNAQILRCLCPSFALALDRRLCQACQKFALVTGTTTVKPLGDGKYQAEKPYGFRCMEKNEEVDPLQNNEPCFAPAYKAVMEAK